MRPTWVEVNTGNIAHNIRRVKSLLPPSAKMMAVVKADGYGHGAVPVAITALDEGASFLGVALVEEGVALRRAGVAAPILLMGAFFPWQVPDMIKFGLTATVASYDSARALSDAACSMGKTAKVHIKVDTGMGRLGLPPAETLDLAVDVARLPGIEIEGIFTHFCCAECDEVMTRRQLEQFHDLTEKLRAMGFDPLIRHIANTAAAISMPETALDMVRVGIAMYGMSPTGVTPPGPQWAPALSFHTRVSYVKLVQAGATVSYGATYVAPSPVLIATLPVGYADGYSRLLSGKAEVLIGGTRYPVVGRVCMDQTMVALPPDAQVAVGDEVVLIGSQGDEAIYAEDIARTIGTISYEVVCGLSKRVPRVYVSGKE